MPAMDRGITLQMRHVNLVARLVRPRVSRSSANVWKRLDHELVAAIHADLQQVGRFEHSLIKRNRKFVDSPLEGDGFELLVRGRGEVGCRAL